MIYDKLVRDRIPTILEAKGKKFKVCQIAEGFEKGNYLKTHIRRISQSLETVLML